MRDAWIGGQQFTKQMNVIFFFLNNVFSYKLSFDKDFNFKIWIISWIPFFQSPSF